MIQRVHECAKACEDVSEVFVATDDERILQSVEAFGGKAIMTKEKHPSGTDRIAEAVDIIGVDKNDLIVNIQGDQPIFEPAVITHLVNPLKVDRDIPMGTLQCILNKEKEVGNPNNVKVVTDKEGFAIYFSRSPVPFFRDSTSSRIYYKHLGFYAYQPEFLSKFASLPVGRLEAAEKLEQLRALENGFKIKVAETPYDSVEVDAPGDIKKVEALLAAKT